jgi:hypothetical protein
MPMAHVDFRCSSRAETDRHWVVTGDTVVSQRPRLGRAIPYRQTRSPFPAVVGERAPHPPGSERA